RRVRARTPELPAAPGAACWRGRAGAVARPRAPVLSPPRREILVTAGRRPCYRAARCRPGPGPTTGGFQMQFRFVRVLALLAVIAGTFAGMAKALDFDDEDPQPPHPEIGLVYHYEIGTHAGCLPHHVIIVSGQLPPGLKLTQLNDHTALVDGIATEAGVFSVWLAVKDCENKSAEALFTFDTWGRRWSIATDSLPAAAAGSPYSAKLVGQGVQSNVTYAVSAGALPAGLTLA